MRKFVSCFVSDQFTFDGVQLHVAGVVGQLHLGHFLYVALDARERVKDGVEANICLILLREIEQVL